MKTLTCDSGLLTTFHPPDLNLVPVQMLKRRRHTGPGPAQPTACRRQRSGWCSSVERQPGAARLRGAGRTKVCGKLKWSVPAGGSPPGRCGAIGRREHYLHPERRDRNRRDRSGPLAGAAAIGDRWGHRGAHTPVVSTRQHTAHGILKVRLDPTNVSAKIKTTLKFVSIKF